MILLIIIFDGVINMTLFNQYGGSEFAWKLLATLEQLDAFSKKVNANVALMH